MSAEFRAFLVWLLGGTLALMVALQWTPVVYVDGAFIPWGNDSFYHARRILDAAANPTAFYQFDPYIHAPEGSWLTWPWAYDLGVAYLLRAVVALGISPDFERALMYVPAVWVLVNVALLLALAASLRLSTSMRVLCMLCFALSPLTLALHGVGQIDHHFLELSFVLATALLMLLWSARPGARGLAFGLAVILGVAPAFHNGLFILQLPVIAACALLWRRGMAPPPGAIATFALTLVTVTLAVLLPSGPFRAGLFEFFTLSWFHLYVACTVALMSLLLARAPYTPLRAVQYVLFGVVAVVPLLAQVSHGGRFLRADFINLAEMPEARSLLTVAGTVDGWRTLTALYSWLLVLTPLTLAWSVYVLLARRHAQQIVLAAFAVFGLLLLTQQLRLHYFGWFAIVLPPLLCADWFIARFRRARHLARFAVTAIVIASLLPGLKMVLRTPPSGGEPNYALLSPLFPPLAAACRAQPGVILAEHNLGHPLRFHTECAVIANNMIMTPQHFAKLAESAALLQLTPDALRQQAPWIRYIVVVNSPKYGNALKQQLLVSDSTPPGYDLLARVNLPAGDGLAYRVAAAYRIRPAPLKTPTARAPR